MHKNIREAATVKASIQVSNKSAQLNAPFVIKTDGKGYYIINGELVDKKDYEALYPIHDIPVRKNSCRKGLWMGNEKSY